MQTSLHLNHEHYEQWAEIMNFCLCFVLFSSSLLTFYVSGPSILATATLRE